MGERRRWDAAVLGALVIVGAFALSDGREAAAESVVLIAATIGMMAGYLLFARADLGRDDPSWRVPVFLTVAAVSLCAGIAADPFFAMAQTVAYPLTWAITRTERQAIAGSFVIAAAAFLGFAIGGGFSTESLLNGATTAGFSILFTVIFGLWISSIARHAEERGRLLGELSSAQAEVEALSRERGAAQERERLAREIHDTLAQTLAGLVILAEQAGRRARGGDPDGAAQTVERLESAARDALDETRAIVAHTAAVPSDAALEEAVERLAARFRADTGLDIVVAAPAGRELLERDTQVVVLRCLQEALANVRKHARAGRVRVAVERAPDGGVRLVVSDDGRGFDTAAAGVGYGLDGMRERLALAGGALAISSSAAGTTLTAELPGVTAPVGGGA